MEMIRRRIKLFFVSYGKLLLLIIGGFAIVIFVVQSLNNKVIEENNLKTSSTEYKEQQKLKEEIKTDREYISKFIDFCNERKIEEAYEMLSENCKQEKYNTIEEFENKYINTVFNINIRKYKITRKENIYINTLTQDALVTGKTDSTIETKCKFEGVLERKIYIIN